MDNRLESLHEILKPCKLTARRLYRASYWMKKQLVPQREKDYSKSHTGLQLIP
jgi:hypothetical protein